MKFLILAFDGGGVRVVLQWKLLQRLLQEFPNLIDNVDVFAGTSAGAILASALASGLEKTTDVLLSEDNIKLIFRRSVCQKVESLGGLRSAKYENHHLHRLLEHTLGDTRIHDLQRTLFVTSFALNGMNPSSQQTENEPYEHMRLCFSTSMCSRWHTMFYHNLKEEPLNDEEDPTVVEAVMKSAAAPIYFPMVQNCVDGGIAHNNPSLAILTHLTSQGVALEDIYVLSFGSGETPQSLNVPDNSSLGVLDYLSPFVNLIFDASAEVITQSCRGLLHERFCRINPLLDPTIALDDTTSYDRMTKLANDYDLSRAIEWINKNVME